MRLITVNSFDAGQRLDRYLMRYMDAAPRSFFYRMLRKKNITLNGKKADGTERLAAGDEIRLFLSEKTIMDFQSRPVHGPVESPAGTFSEHAQRHPCAADGRNHAAGEKNMSAERLAAQMPDILYEDADVIVMNKPAGMLSQRARPGDVSLCEILTAYMMTREHLSEEDLRTFRPSVCHRLDRNTSGAIAAGKSIRGLSQVTELLRLRRADKLYLCLVSSHVTEPATVTDYVTKDSRTNQVAVRKTPPGDQVITEYRPIAAGGLPGHSVTLLEVRLITGKTHQIRAQLASLGMPVVGDRKYGSEEDGRYFRDHAKVKRQLLHSWKITFPADCGELTEMAGRTVTAPLPEDFRRALQILRIPLPDLGGKTRMAKPM